jgi:formylglycine-generating enzyme required for sulfatase activity
MPKLVIHEYQRTAQYFREDLGNDIQLDMMLIPGGTFIMGSPEEEKDSYNLGQRSSSMPFCVSPLLLLGRTRRH